jgi:predicted dehydrogenase
VTDGVRLTAVCNRHADRAKAACAAFGADHAFISPHDLAACEDVDLVVVAVRVPEHAAVVEAAQRAGKRVYCEWPLGRTAEEARRLAAEAREDDVVGLQARAAPAVRLVRDIVRRGDIGDVLSSSLVASARGWGASTDEALEYTEDARNGASMLAIAFGHAVDALCWALGDFVELSATLATRRREIPVADTGRVVRRTVHDQVAVTGMLTEGAVVSIHYRGGRSAGTNFLWEVNGTDGDVLVTARSGQLQMASPTVSIGRGRELADITPPSSSGEAANVVEAYGLLATGRDGLASFADAAARHDLLARVEEHATAFQSTTVKELHA